MIQYLQYLAVINHCPVNLGVLPCFKGNPVQPRWWTDTKHCTLNFREPKLSNNMIQLDLNTNNLIQSGPAQMGGWTDINLQNLFWQS